MLIIRYQRAIIVLLALCFFVAVSNAQFTEARLILSTASSNNSALITEMSDLVLSENSTALIASPVVFSIFEKMDQCPDRSVSIVSMDFSFGAIDGIYQIAQKLCQELQAELDDQYLQKIADIVTAKRVGKLQAKDIYDFLRKQIWPILLLIMAIMFIIFLPLTGICFFCGRCCCNCCGAKRKHVNPSKIYLCSYLTILVVVLAVMVAALLLYSQSVIHTFNGISNLNQSVIEINTDAIETFKAASNDMTCKIDLTLGILIDELKYMIWIVPSTVYEKLKQSSSHKVIQSAIDDVGKVANETMQAILLVEQTVRNTKNLSPEVIASDERLIVFLKLLDKINQQTVQLHENINEIHEGAINTWNNLNGLTFSSSNVVNSTLKHANAMLDDAHQQVEEVIRTMNYSVDEINQIIQYTNDEVKQIYESTASVIESSTISTVLYVLVLGPSLLVIIPIIIVVLCGSVRLASNDKYPSKRPRIYSCGGYLGLLAIAVAFSTGWIVMLVASISFIGGYSLEAICGHSFYDPQMRLLKYATFSENSPVKLFNEEHFSLKAGDVLQQCKDDHTILSALNFGNLMNVDGIMQKANINAIREAMIEAFRNANLTYQISEDQLNEFNVFLAQLKDLNNHLQNFTIPENKTIPAEMMTKLTGNYNNLKNTMSHLIDNLSDTENKIEEQLLSYANSDNFTKESIHLLNKIFNETLDEMTSLIYDSKEYLLTNSFNCRSIYDIWQNTGNVLCQQINLPLQGLWTTASLIALSFLILIVITTLIIKYLFRMSKKYELDKKSSESNETMITTTDTYL